MYNIIKITALSAAVILGSVSGALAMSKAEFKSIVVGKTWKWKQGKRNGTIRYQNSGKIKLKITGSKGFKDTGSWLWKGSKLCTTYKKIRKGKTKCIKLTLKGKEILVSSGGKMYR